MAVLGGACILNKFDENISFIDNVNKNILQRATFLYDEATFLLKEELRTPTILDCRPHLYLEPEQRGILVHPILHRFGNWQMEVMRMSEPQAVSSGTLSIQGTCPTCRKDELRRQPIEEDEELLQTNAETTPDLKSLINAIRGGGRPLAESERAYFEPRFGYDFGQVRLHTDTQAAGAGCA
jgi:hypothetical protein